MAGGRNAVGNIYSYQTKTKGERWGAVAEMGYDWETGRRKQERKTGFATKDAAKKWLITRMSARISGDITEPSMQPLGHWLNEWLELRRPSLRDSSIEIYLQVFRWFQPLHATPLARLTVAHIERELARLVREGHTQSSVAGAKEKLSTPLRAAVRMGKITSNPASLAEGPSAKSARRVALSADQVAALLEATTDDGQWHLLWRFMLETWVRRGEVTELRWRDIDLENGIVNIERALTKVRRLDPVRGREVTRFIAGKPKTADSIRSIAISDDLVVRLRSHRVKQMEESLLFGRQWSGDTLVFASRNGTWLNRDRISAQLTEACRKAKVPRVTIHELRHTGGSLILQAGFDMKTISERMGHSSMATTMRVYSHSNEQQHRRMASAIGDLFVVSNEPDSEAL